jgi:hypothetical protein
MRKILERISLLAINYLTVLPLLFFLIATSQGKELSKLLSVLKTSSNF